MPLFYRLARMAAVFIPCLSIRCPRPPEGLHFSWASRLPSPRFAALIASYTVCVRNQIAATKKTVLPMAKAHHTGLTLSLGVMVRGLGDVK